MSHFFFGKKPKEIYVKHSAESFLDLLPVSEDEALFLSVVHSLLESVHLL